MAHSERRLAAILVADIERYSKLMNEDERGTILKLRDVREKILKVTLENYSGITLKNTGDGFLAEFKTITGAVECAIEMQLLLLSHNLGIPDDEQLKFRMGINLGEVTFDEDDFYGDGVNIASRLEGLADAPGICISSHVYDQIRNKVKCNYENIGDIHVKNISEPVRVYRVLFEPIETTSDREIGEQSYEAQIPTIAVLPFDNMSSDPEQEFFADGLTEDITTELSRFGGLFVISRNSTFTYKGKKFKATEVAEELKVRYVVEGSVRKVGNRVRVNAQLIDGIADRHVWADKYDRDLEDIFTIQDEITSAITATLPGRIEAENTERARRMPTESMPAYECVLAGKIFHHNNNQNDNKRARELLERAIEIDPSYAHARAWRACVLGQGIVNGWLDKEANELMSQITDDLNEALALDEDDADIHRILAAISIGQDNLEQAQHHQNRAHRLNPNYDLVVVQSGELLTWLGRPEESVELITQAMKLNPYHPPRFWGHLGRAYFTGKHYDEARTAIEHVAEPDLSQCAFLVASYGFLERTNEATRFINIIHSKKPNTSIENLMPLQHYDREGDREHFRAGLRMAGFKEGR